MKGRVWLFALVMAAFVGPPRAMGSEAWPLQVYQPFDLPNGIAVSAVSYVGFFWGPGVVEMTCWPNRIWHPEDSTAYQENAAFAAKLKVSADWGNHWPDDRDTVTAVLDVSRLPLFHSENGWQDTAVLAATVECLRANVGQFGPRVRFLRIELEGPGKYAAYGGVFDLTGYECGPKARQFPLR